MKWIATTPEKQWQTMQLTDTPASAHRLTLTGEECQTVEGFGGCFNELSYIALSSLDKSEQDKVLDELFSKEGCAFNWGRISVGANDYAERWYSHNETDQDYDMSAFSIARDEKYVLPYIREAQKRCPNMKFFASPWSPPTWMKNPPVYNYGRMVRDEKTQLAYCEYFRRFLDAYEKEGVKVSRLCLQNEPFADQKFPSCLWSSEEFRVFIRDYIGPYFEKNNVDTEIWLGTLNGPTEMDFTMHGIVNDLYSSYIDNILFDDEARKYISGLGYQWNGQRVIHKTHETFPELGLMQTENECGDGSNNWTYAAYIFDLVRHYFQYGVTVYTYWNMILQPGGSSTWGWRQNTMITIDPETKTVTYNPEFYVMKHYAHFIKPGAKVLAGSGHWNMSAMAFKNPDGEIIVVVQNTLDRERTFTFEGEGKSFSAVLAPHSMNTFAL